MPELPARSRIVQQCLIDAGVDGLVRELPGSARTAADAAAEVGCPVGAIASSLVFLADGEPLLVMTSGAHRVDTAYLAQSLGTASITKASADDVRAATGQAIGGVAPVGHPHPLRTVVDEALRDYAVLWAAGGTPRTVFPLSFDDLVRITGGQVARVAP